MHSFQKNAMRGYDKSNLIALDKDRLLVFMRKQGCEVSKSVSDKDRFLGFVGKKGAGNGRGMQVACC